MFQSKPNEVREEVNESKVISSVFKELFHSAGVVIGGVVISALLISREGRNLGQH